MGFRGQSNGGEGRASTGPASARHRSYTAAALVLPNEFCRSRSVGWTSKSVQGARDGLGSPSYGTFQTAAVCLAGFAGGRTKRTPQ